MFCRICLEEGGELIHPCRCSGTMKYVHPHCMQEWFYQNIDITRCEICHHPFTFKTHKTVLQRIITKLSDVLLMEVYVCFYYLIIYMGSLLFTICGLDCHILDDCQLRHPTSRILHLNIYFKSLKYFKERIAGCARCL